MTTKKMAQLSLLSAACVVGRIIFQFIPNFQPMTAIFLWVVLLFGLRDAYIVMTLSLLLSSIYFAIGPWVIGQWLSYVLVLSLFALIFNHSFLKKKRGFLAVGFFLSGFLYGLGMTTFDVVLYRLPQPLIYYLQGISFDMMHSIGNLLFYIIFLPVVMRFKQNMGGKNEKNN